MGFGKNQENEVCGERLISFFVGGKMAYFVRESASSPWAIKCSKVEAIAFCLEQAAEVASYREISSVSLYADSDYSGGACPPGYIKLYWPHWELVCDACEAAIDEKNKGLVSEMGSLCSDCLLRG